MYRERFDYHKPAVHPTYCVQPHVTHSQASGFKISGLLLSFYTFLFALSNVYKNNQKHSHKNLLVLHKFILFDNV